MKQREAIKLQSYQRTILVLLENESLFDSDEAGKSQIKLFIAYNNSLQELVNKLNKSCKWLTKEKNELVIQLTQSSDKLMVACIRLANYTGNSLLLNQIGNLKQELRKNSNVSLLSVSEQLYNLALSHKDELLAYSISPDLIKEHKQLIDDIQVKLAKRSQILDQNKQNKLEFEEALRSIDKLLKDQLDWTLKGYIEKYPELVSEYFATRRLTKIIKQHINLRGFIYDKETGERISYGTVSILETDMKTKITEKGNFVFKNLPQGEYTLRVENLNYETLLLTVRRYSNENIKLSIEMQSKAVIHPAK